MKQELADRIHASAPKLYNKKYCEAEKEAFSPRALARKYGPTYIGVSDGWYLILLNLSIALELLDEDIQVTQIKEKFGGLRFYIGPATERAHKLIEEAEELSMETCEECGEPGRSRSDLDWITTLCDMHHAKARG